MNNLLTHSEALELLQQFEKVHQLLHKRLGRKLIDSLKEAPKSSEVSDDYFKGFEAGREAALNCWPQLNEIPLADVMKCFESEETVDS